MTIPLKTYDPDWKAKWKAIHNQLEAEQKKPYKLRDQKKTEGLLSDMHAAFHSQFRTTGAYAEWMEDKLKEAVRHSSFKDFPIPIFPREASVDRTQKLYIAVTDRLRLAESAERNLLDIEIPLRGMPFSQELHANETRAMGVMPLAYNMPIFDGNRHTGFSKEVASYSFVMEKRLTKANVCFFQLQDDGPSPINVIEQLATELYREQFGPVAIAKGNKYYSPKDMDFFIYIPPYVTGEERFIRVGMTADNKKVRFENPQWKHETTVPYILRKQAAVDGLAKDPDVPARPIKQPRPPAGTDNS